MTTLFISPGDYSWGSSRMRCYWPARYMKDAAVIGTDSPISTNYDAYIFMKQAANYEAMDRLRQAGKKVYFDLCDPMWWWNPKGTLEIAKVCNRVVCSSLGLGEDFTYCSKIDCDVIPDRLDLSHFTKTKVHAESNPIRLIWYGVSVNRISLFAALANLERLVANGCNIELTICDDRPDAELSWTDMLPVKHRRWSVENEVSTILEHDIALLPPYPGAWGKVKSNNKTLTAWACGLPVSTGEDYYELYDLCKSVEMRQALGTAGRNDVVSNWNVKNSAFEWQELINQ